MPSKPERSPAGRFRSGSHPARRILADLHTAAGPQPVEAQPAIAGQKAPQRPRLGNPPAAVVARGNLPKPGRRKAILRPSVPVPGGCDRDGPERSRSRVDAESDGRGQGAQGSVRAQNQRHVLALNARSFWAWESPVRCLEADHRPHLPGSLLQVQYRPPLPSRAETRVDRSISRPFCLALREAWAPG